MHLHSTMIRLIEVFQKALLLCGRHLHSTMIRLIGVARGYLLRDPCLFTFHND